MSAPTVGIIIQARMGSSRLPGKVLMPVGSRTLLGQIFFRLAHRSHASLIVVATTRHSRDDVIEEFCRDSRIDCFRGDELDVLDRYYRCASAYGFQHIVRMTADNPFPDIDELDRLIAWHLATGADYSHCFPVLPVGVGMEMFSFPALEQSWHQGRQPHHREHVNEYLIEHPELFATQVLQVPAVKNRPGVRLTVDTAEDHRRAQYVASNASADYLSVPEAIALAEQFDRLTVQP